MNSYVNLYFDEKNHRFSLFSDNLQKIYFAYWHELKKHEIRYLPAGEKFKATLEDNIDFPHSRGVKITEIELGQSDIFICPQIIKNETISCEYLLHLLKNNNTENQIIFINCIFENIDIDNLTIPNTLAIISSEFVGSFRLISCDIHGDLWLPNCRFNKHFSLNSSTVFGSVHLESSDFSGPGGASFRRLKSTNLYLDLGVYGGYDPFWLNEMLIPGVVSIGGEFKNELQILHHQDKDEEVPFTPSIGSIIIGQELYEFEKANRTTIKSELKIHEVNLTEQLHIEYLEADEVRIQQVSAEKIYLDHLSVISDATISGCISKLGSGSDGAMQLILSSIGRHLKVDDNKFNGGFNLSGTAVSEVTYFENNEFGESGRLNINRFTTSRFLIYPEACLFGNSREDIFSPKDFSVLTASNNRELGDQYCALKHWLADAGKLEMEDIAFFHMRQCYHSNSLTRYLFGGLFGWGVRLSNIAISSSLLVLLFSAIYLFCIPALSFSRAFSLSVQSFISSFFGKWSDYDPDGMIANIVTLESILGVLFITVFIGAYIRKLLR